MPLITGQTVTVQSQATTGVDELNNPVTAWQDEATVHDVLVAPASTDDLTGSIRPQGDEVVLVAHFPRTYTASLRGRRVVVDGTTYDVVGDPRPYQPANTPGRWDRPVHLKEVTG